MSRSVRVFHIAPLLAMAIAACGAQTLPGQLKLSRARELAQPRLEALRAFLAAAGNEGCAADD